MWEHLNTENQISLVDIGNITHFPIPYQLDNYIFKTNGCKFKNCMIRIRCSDCECLFNSIAAYKLHNQALITKKKIKKNDKGKNVIKEVAAKIHYRYKVLELKTELFNAEIMH